jgi:hypothetical protein
LNLGHQLFFASLLQNYDFNRVRLIHNVGRIVGVLEHKLELLEVAATLELQVVLIAEETLAQRAADCFYEAVVDTERHHF